MGNCLVTKLKGTVDNDSLVKVGQTIFRFRQTGGDDNLDWFDIAVNGGGELSMLAPNGGSFVMAGGSSNPGLANSKISGWIRKASSGLTDVVFDSCYNVDRIVNMYCIEEAIGLSSMMYNLRGVQFSYIGDAFATDFLTEMAKHSHFVFVRFTNSNIPADLALAAVRNNLGTLIYVSAKEVPCSAVSDSSVIQIFGGCGNLEDLPVIIRDIDGFQVNGYMISGNISTWVAKAIAGGRTTGAIRFLGWPIVFPGITITIDAEVVSLSSYMSSIGLNARSSVYISWDTHGQITLSQGTAPTNYVAPDVFL